MKIYGNCFHHVRAGQYYRIKVPLRAMERQGLATVFLDDPFQDELKRRDFLFTSDIQLHYLTGGKAIHLQTQKLAEMKPATDSYGHLQHPPVMVYDMDDDIETVNPLNPKFSTLGTRSPDGTLLLPRAEIGIEFEDGDQTVIQEPLMEVIESE